MPSPYIPNGRSIILVVAALCLFLFRPTITVAQENFLPNLEVVFEYGRDAIELTASDLDNLTQRSIRTHSPYYKGQVEFSGPMLVDLLTSVAGQDIGDYIGISLYALNNYVVHTTFGELKRIEALLATRREGKRLSIRERGPYWIILPLTDRKELDSEHFHKLMVWQLQKIRFGGYSD
ncbi:hypothetical protein [Marinobacter sp.]|uniref:hypothetical protein n=1 Tax=Marinobacter sp. TaxID=50741 RepID=UPI0019A070D5|nr:hypothetical protein [Marinobacter sp.]MBD3657100.1 hypothetical protein [Marinobacter sp.]